MKQRISSLDLQLLARELKAQLEGCRLANLYNVADASKQFLLKFTKGESKISILIDCGLKIFATEFSRPIPPSPGPFVAKLRKHLKAKRLTTVKQVGADRILVLSFADGLFFLVLEFFAAGNVILLDADRRILALQRVVRDHEQKVGEIYNMFDDHFLEDVSLPVPKLDTHTLPVVQELLIKTKTAAEESKAVMPAAPVGGRKQSLKVPSIHKLLFSSYPYLSSDLLNKILKEHGIDPSQSFLELFDSADQLVDILNIAEKEAYMLLTSEKKNGYILARENPLYDEKKDAEGIRLTYEQFHPFRPYLPDGSQKKFEIVEVDGDYNRTVDKFFSTIDSTKYALRIQTQEQNARKKLEKAKAENQKKIQALVEVQHTNEQRGNAIINNIELVEEAKSAIQGLLDQQMDWTSIEKLIKTEQAKSNRIARVIKLPLNLKANKISVELPLSNEDDESSDGSWGDSESDSGFSSSDDELSDSGLSDFDAEVVRGSGSKNKKGKSKVSNKSITVSIDLSMSAYANASSYFEMKKTGAKKQLGVEQNVQKAMKNIEQKIEKDLKKKLKEQHDVLQVIRSPYFFEKYFWFISTEGFLVLMGKSGIETDQIYSKYIEDDDVYVSNGFGSQVWIKNFERTEIPPNTLMQAGIFANSASEAWSKKVATSPWWCAAKNLSKFDDVGGGLLPSGAFRLKSDEAKNFLPPAQLVMGFAFMWKIKTDDDQEAGYEEDMPAEIDEMGEVSHPSEEMVEESIGPADNLLPSNSNQSINDIIDDIPRVVGSESPVEQTAGVSGLAETKESTHDSESVVVSIIENMNKNVRGKKGKLKKIQKKYSNQDEEDILLKLQALGTLKGIEKQQKEKESEFAREQEREVKKKRREKQQQAQALKFTSSEKVKVNYKKIFKELKPVISADEEVLAPIPVFAPWPALTKYKYKVKVQPGTAKKTKSVNDVLHYFQRRNVDPLQKDKEADWPVEHELLKVFKDQDFIPLICVDKLKVSIPGGGEKQGSKTKSKKK
ncbi:AGL017Wp [Eremothecium gossypii ATCC 10895]|uniref:Ribosome quality control complex subunit 2 n=1 Tax=Eremothecium gossypii (strain ATCC 10895 / CBS 109.51 / FGSC 9923 / NRRL Y-1056) TaxID=284811 RepID=Q750H0_EREGS|nr:AGL017Wp [Eremothecium gossypii ATCC 10895]AAS54473.2 AGL017Wp [Eremothecium gossypii ATCC 10895]